MNLTRRAELIKASPAIPNPESNFAIKNRGYKPLLQKITIPFPEEIHVDVGVSSLYPFLFLFRTYAILSIARALKERSCKKRRRFLDTT